MTALTKSQLLAVIAASSQPIFKEIDGIGGLHFKKLTVSEQGELSQKTNKDNVDNVTASLHMIAYSVCDENGKRLFSDKDIDELGKMNAETLTKLVDTISEINGFDKTINDIKKN